MMSRSRHPENVSPQTQLRAPVCKIHTSRGGGMLLQLCSMAMAQCNNAVWVPVPIIYTPKTGYRWWQTADLLHSVRTAHGAP